ncbi:hypothetical protein DPMN_156251 [Dreissena polymorpha]|uniref:Uncharacterized protein n=1 Tax=Dreissena polymorpha TaxID=45954 RepID=A0A9D4FST2_DREPO|nr:hypothetical protein DPMN_156251 [Dreissena polymorpha]
MISVDVGGVYDGHGANSYADGDVDVSVNDANAAVLSDISDACVLWLSMRYWVCDVYVRFGK